MRSGLTLILSHFFAVSRTSLSDLFIQLCASLTALATMSKLYNNVILVIMSPLFNTTREMVIKTITSLYMCPYPYKVHAMMRSEKLLRLIVVVSYVSSRIICFQRAYDLFVVRLNVVRAA
jgi:hypothetical protein